MAVSSSDIMPTLEAEYERRLHVDVDDDDSEEEENGYSDEAGPSKQNGVAHRQVDRYGFLGGDQYTNPEQ